MGYALLNLGSFILGLIAWVFPVINLAKRKKTDNVSWSIFSIISMSACAVSLYMQMLYGNYLVNIEDWSALVDTRNAVSLVSSVLLIVTITLNGITASVYYKSKRK